MYYDEIEGPKMRRRVPRKRTLELYREALTAVQAYKKQVLDQDAFGDDVLSIMATARGIDEWKRYDWECVSDACRTLRIPIEVGMQLTAWNDQLDDEKELDEIKHKDSGHERWLYFCWRLQREIQALESTPRRPRRKRLKIVKVIS
jgi:hypothetical protein